MVEPSWLGAPGLWGIGAAGQKPLAPMALNAHLIAAIVRAKNKIPKRGSALTASDAREFRPFLFFIKTKSASDRSSQEIVE
jgi:hypothetical protein